MAKTFGVVAVLTVLSKVIGLARDMVVNAAYGTSVVADAFNYAYLFTGNILILFGGLGGPFHSSTVAIVTPQKDNRETGALIAQILVLTIAALLVVTLLFYVFATPLADWMASQYKPNVPVLAHTAAGQAAVTAMNDTLFPAKKALLAHQFHAQLLIMLPLIVISGIVGVSYGVLNVYNKILWPSLSPAIASIAVIASVFIASLVLPAEQMIFIGVPLAIGTLIGAIGQMLAQVPGLFALPLNWRLSSTPEPGLGDYGKMLWPAVISTSVGQLTVYVDMWFALNMVPQQGAWTAVVNSNRLVQLPLGILLTAMLVPILPRFTELATADKPEDVKHELRRALSFLWFTSIPMTALLFVLPRPIIEVLFQRGNFDTASTDIVTAALLFLAPSIVFYVARDLMTRVFYAYKDSTTPYRVAMVAILVKAALDWTLLSMLGSVEMISLASSIMTVFNLTLLTWALKRKIGNLGFTRMAKPVAVMLAGGILCGGVAFFSYHGLMQQLHTNSSWIKLPVLALASMLGGGLYLGLCLMFHLDEPVMFARRVPVLKNFFPST